MHFAGVRLSAALPARLRVFLRNTEEYYRARGIELGHYQTLELYMALGGIPHYLKEVHRGESAAQAIDRICFSRDGLLRDEFTQLYVSLFEKAERHEQVVRTLAKKRRGVSRNELLKAAGLNSGGGTTTLLEELEAAGFILRSSQFGLDKKDALYRLADEYSLFYLSWIERHRGQAQGTWVKKRNSPAWRAWSGCAFEAICLKHVVPLKRALGVEAVETEESAWHYRSTGKHEVGAQVDLVIDRKDSCINLCEMKFSEGEFVIDRRYAADLRNKRDTFRRVTGTRKTIFITMVTTFGVRQNRYRDELVASCVEMDALFR